MAKNDERLSVFQEPQVGQEFKEVHENHLRSCVKGCLQEQTGVSFWNLDDVGGGESNWVLRIEILLYGFREPQLKDCQ